MAPCASAPSAAGCCSSRGARRVRMAVRSASSRRSSSAWGRIDVSWPGRRLPLFLVPARCAAHGSGRISLLATPHAAGHVQGSGFAQPAADLPGGQGLLLQVQQALGRGGVRRRQPLQLRPGAGAYELGQQRPAAGHFARSVCTRQLNNFPCPMRAVHCLPSSTRMPQAAARLQLPGRRCTPLTDAVGARLP